MSDQMDDMRQNLRCYTEQAKSFSDYFGSHDPEKVLPWFCRGVKAFDRDDETALDLGSSSGHYASWIAEQGWPVVALDGSQAMLDIGKELHTHNNIEWVCDLAPALEKLKGRRFHCILMTAFIFHFDEKARHEIYNSLVSCLEDDVLVYITTRHGPTPEGRAMYDVPVDEIAAVAENWGMGFRNNGDKKDLKNRDSVTWRQMMLWRGDKWSKIMDN